MLLAELQIWHTRPITPTRRIALGHLVLPTDPAPGLGGILLLVWVTYNMLTSNLPFEEWPSVFQSERLTGALLDRLTHHVHILELNGDSYRLKHSASRKRTAAGAEQNKASADSQPAD